MPDWKQWGQGLPAMLPWAWPRMDLKELPARAFARHPWETVRADFFLRLLRERLDARALQVLDIGAGDGFFAGRLLARLPTVTAVTCFDPGYDAAWLANPPPHDRRLTFTANPPGGRFDLVLLLDVLEHAEDDRSVLEEAIANMATPGGWLLASAPAYPLLFSRHDELLGHRRRYDPAALHAMLARNGLLPVAHGQLFASLLLPRAIAKLSEAATKHRTTGAPSGSHVETGLGSWHHGPMVTKAAQALLSLDAAAARQAAAWRLPLPGLSTWVLARRR
jgi:2-polyprenyl-3-methyl-5-hydroxy-6-metoxy-1,4-benzoquinol methylase